MQTVRRRCSKLFDCERCSLFVVDEESSSLVGLSAEDDTTETHFPLRTGLTGRVANSGEKINLKDAYQDPQFRPEIDWQAGYRVRSFLCFSHLVPALILLFLGSCIRMFRDSRNGLLLVGDGPGQAEYFEVGCLYLGLLIWLAAAITAVKAARTQALPRGDPARYDACLCVCRV